MNDSDRLMKLGLAVGKVLDVHDKAAAEMVPGFRCGCKMVCEPLVKALEEVGLARKLPKAKR